MTNQCFEDKRLLEALNYIDERFIAEVTEDYEIFDAPGEYRYSRRARFKAYRQFAALAACLILLSAAFPVVTRFVSTAIDSIAGWGSGTVEENSEPYVDTLDSTEEDSETRVDTSETTNGMYDEYVPTEEELAGLNALWKEATGEIFASTPEFAMRRSMSYGTFYYGKYGDCIVFANASNFCAEKEYIVGDYRFVFPMSNYLLVYYDSKIYTINQAYDNGYLTDYHIKKLNEFHTQFFIDNYGDYNHGGYIE